jgi:hypothetical protein
MIDFEKLNFKQEDLISYLFAKIIEIETEQTMQRVLINLMAQKLDLNQFIKDSEKILEAELLSIRLQHQQYHESILTGDSLEFSSFLKKHLDQK